MSKQKTEQKYFEALKDLRELLKYTDSIHATKFENERKIPHAFILIAARNGLIERTGTRRKYKYKWNTIEPTLEMARTLRLKICEYIKGKSKRSLDKKIKQQVLDLESQKMKVENLTDRSKLRYNIENLPEYVDEINQSSKITEQSETKSFSILWGLFKFERRIEK